MKEYNQDIIAERHHLAAEDGQQLGSGDEGRDGPDPGLGHSPAGQQGEFCSSIQPPASPLSPSSQHSTPSSASPRGESRESSMSRPRRWKPCSFSPGRRTTALISILRYISTVFGLQRKSFDCPGQDLPLRERTVRLEVQPHQTRGRALPAGGLQAQDDGVRERETTQAESQEDCSCWRRRRGGVMM